MNIFRLLGDLSHLLSILILLDKMNRTKSCAGISFKSQALYLLVYVTRYLDIFTSFSANYYNTIFKLLFLSSSGYTLYKMATTYKPTSSAPLDTFRVPYLLAFSIVFALITTYKYTFFEISWAFSIWLESVAILPQLFMLQRTGEADTITVNYIAALGAYRALYIPNWIWRWAMESRVEWVAVVAGVSQTVLYSDFFWIYYTKVMKGKKFALPV